ncbi:pyridoxamine 5'-phosphate oxidase family protein [Paenibacillus sp. MBLB4367]|uniref:pyridoxamine 5'-phosphate oxidase family protein n=1 Tax=Paenibacillus sp. MBLB4367 TaxID=3384767 RepID=UPI0039082455
MNPFHTVIGTEEELRELLGYPSPLAVNKVIGQLDAHCREFIAKSPIAFIATADASGACDVSPRGDAPGFTAVLGDKHLLIPERPGNRRIDSMRNILANPQIGVIFIIPGLEETLRINGKACIVKDTGLLSALEAHGKIPLLGIGIEVEQCFVHCAKAFKRSKLWDSGSWPEWESLPSMPKILAEHAKSSGLTEGDVSAVLKESYEKRLY